MKMSLKLSVSILIIALASGCAKEPPKCSDEQTLEIIRSIIMEQIGGSANVTEPEIKDTLKFEYPKATAYDEKIKKYSCDATLIAGETYRLPITYDSQLDDHDQHIVSVGGILKGDLLGVENGFVEAVKAKRDSLKPASETAVPATPPPVQVKAEDTVKLEAVDGVKEFQSRYGKLAVLGDTNAAQLFFNDKLLRDKSDFGLSIEKNFTDGDKDILLVAANSGGTGCPVQFLFVTITPTDVNVSNEFGSCSDLYTTGQKDGSVFVTMAGNESNPDNETFAFKNGVVSQNGKPLQ